MAVGKKCGCRRNEKSEKNNNISSNTPQNIQTNTMITSDDFAEVRNIQSYVTQTEVDEATVAVNPDAESMESRG